MNAAKESLSPRPLTALISALIWVGLPAMTLAQDDAEGLKLEEVTVTATKREQSIQDIPISIQAITGEAIDDFAVTNIQDLSARVPNLIIGYGITAQSVSIRGLGSGQDRSFEQSVGMFSDGVYLPRSRQYRNPFFDVERVEVMRGPQAVLQGLNSTAGAISALLTFVPEQTGQTTCFFLTCWSKASLLRNQPSNSCSFLQMRLKLIIP